MRIVVLGNCQANGVAHALVHLLPEASVKVAQIDTGPRTPRGLAAAALVQDCDVVFTQTFAPNWGPLATKALVGAGPRVVRLPVVAFNGYQPDLTYFSHEGRQLLSPVGAYHSSIIAAAFALEVPEGDVPALFNRLVYARLGYFEAFGKARTLLQDTLAPLGPRFSGLFESWHARGPFMHTANHPRIFVLADIARAAAIDAGLLPEARRALAASIGIPFYVKHAGRWLALRRVEDGIAIYAARPKEMRTAFRRHQPVELRVTIAAGQGR